jgi:death-on-curing protein
MTAGGTEAYPTLAAKAAALGFSLIRNHPFVDGNKPVGHATMATFLFLNGFELQASVEDAERTILAIAKSEIDREALVQWVEGHLVQHPS